MNTKEIEKLGIQAFSEYLSNKYSGSTFAIQDISNSKLESKNLGCDLIVNLDGEELYIELKSSTLNNLPTNIRFTHQTIATMYNAGILSKMIVVYVYNLSNGPENAKFKFFRFGSFKPEQIFIEPHFIIQPKQTIKLSKESQSECPIKDDLDLILQQKKAEQDIGKIFKTQVSDHMKIEI